MHHKGEKKWKILPFQNHQLDKNSVLGPFFIDYPLLPAHMINFLLNTVSTINFALEKVVRTWGEPQKKSFFTNVWSLSQICRNMVSQGTKLLGISNDAQKAFRWPKIVGLSYNFNHTCQIMHLKDKKVAFVFQNSHFDWKNAFFRFSHFISNLHILLLSSLWRRKDKSFPCSPIFSINFQRIRFVVFLRPGLCCGSNAPP